MLYYICYTNEDRIKALRLCAELKASGADAHLIDRGDSELLTDPMEDIMNSIKGCDVFTVLHSEHTNTSMLSQIEITYAKNLHTKICIIKTGHSSISDAIRFELGNAVIINEANMAAAAKKLIKSTEGGN